MLSIHLLSFMVLLYDWLLILSQRIYSGFARVELFFWWTKYDKVRYHLKVIPIQTQISFNISCIHSFSKYSLSFLSACILASSLFCFYFFPTNKASMNCGSEQPQAVSTSTEMTDWNWSWWILYHRKTESTKLEKTSSEITESNLWPTWVQLKHHHVS